MDGVWQTLDTVFWAAVVLGALIFVHELGHFLFARWLGVRVLQFSLGFGPKVWGWQSAPGETEYLLSAVPLGGYVKMLGEGHEDEDEEEGAEPRPLNAEELPFAFSSKPVASRFAIVFAGPFFNFLFAVVVLTAAFWLGVDERLPVIGKVQPNMPAMAAGLQAGDRVVEVDGQPVERWEALSETIRASEGAPLTLAVERASKMLQIRVVPKVQESRNLFGEPVQVALIGITPGDAVVTVQYGFLDGMGKGMEQTWRMVDLTVTGIWKLATQVVSADQIGGPLLIAELAGKSAAQGATNFLFFMALISVNLGILNLLPIPILDGGHLLFFLVEAAKGSPISEEAQLMASRVGMALLGGLMILAFYNDLMRIFVER